MLSRGMYCQPHHMGQGLPRPGRRDDQHRSTARRLVSSIRVSSTVLNASYLLRLALSPPRPPESIVVCLMYVCSACVDHSCGPSKRSPVPCGAINSASPQKRGPWFEARHGLHSPLSPLTSTILIWPGGLSPLCVLHPLPSAPPIAFDCRKAWE